MLTLHRDSRTIVTDEDFSVKIKVVNPACFFDQIPGDVGLGIEIKVNDYTRSEFGNPERFEKYSSGQDRKFAGVSIRFDGATLMAGTLVITNANSEAYSAWLQSELGTVGTKMRDKFITDLELKQDVEFANKSAYDYETDDYACTTVMNPTFWDGKGREIQKTISYTDEEGNPATKEETVNYLTEVFGRTKGFAVNRINGGVIDIYGEACVVSPYLFLHYAVREILRVNKFYMIETNNPLIDPFFQLLIYNNYNIFLQEFVTETRPYYTWDDRLNDYVDIETNEVTNVVWTMGTIDYANLLPRIALKDFILGIQNLLNVVFHFRADNKVEVINRNELIDQEAYSLDDYFLGEWSLGERKDVTLKFISEQDKDDALISEEWHDLSDRRADWKPAVATKADLLAIASPQVGELRLVKNENKIYEYKWVQQTISNEVLQEFQVDALQWTPASLAPQPYFYGDSEEIEEIKTAASSLQAHSYSGIYQIPATRQHGNIGSAKSLWSDFSLRLIPYGVTALNTEVLQMDGEYGLFETRWKKWARFWKNRLPVEGRFALPINEIYYISNNITRKFRTREGEFIIEEMETEYRGNLIGDTVIRGYKV